MVIDRLEFLKALGISKLCLAQHALIPVLSHFCFDKEYIYTYNGTQGLRVSFKTDLECAVPGDLFFKLLDSMTTDTVEIIQKEKEIRIGTGKHKSRVAILSKTDFIFTPPTDYESSDCFSINEEFLKGLISTMLSVNDNPMIRNQSGITFINSDKGRFYSTDGIRMSKYRRDMPFSEKEYRVMFPKVYCALLSSIGSLFKSGILYFGDSFVVGEYDSVLVYTSMIPDLDLLDFEGEIEKCWGKGEALPFEEIPMELFASLNRCLLFLSIQIDQYIDLSIKGNLLKIDVVTELGEIHEELELANDYGEIAFSLDAKLLEQACLATKKLCFKKLEDVGLFIGTDEPFLHILRSPNL